MPYVVNIMPAKRGDPYQDSQRMSAQLPEVFESVESAANFALEHLEERGMLLADWSFNVMDDEGKVIVTADDPEP